MLNETHVTQLYSNQVTYTSQPYKTISYTPFPTLFNYSHTTQLCIHLVTHYLTIYITQSYTLLCPSQPHTYTTQAYTPPNHIYHTVMHLLLSSQPHIHMTHLYIHPAIASNHRNYLVKHFSLPFPTTYTQGKNPIMHSQSHTPHPNT